jgi:hypothetical protein
LNKRFINHVENVSFGKLHNSGSHSPDSIPVEFFVINEIGLKNVATFFRRMRSRQTRLLKEVVIVEWSSKCRSIQQDSEPLWSVKY